MIRSGVRAIACLAVAAVTAAGCGVFGGDDDQVTLEFFQFKPEAVQTFNAIIADFEREHPDIRVQQNHVPEADVAIRTRMVRGDVPDVMTLNANATFGELASAGVFYNFADEDVVDTVNPAILDIINDLGTRAGGEVNGIPFANNADGVIYNKDLFAKHNVEPPATFDELIAAAEKFKAAGVPPFYFTLKDAWTALPAFNALASNLPPENFFEELEADRSSFRDEYGEVAERLKRLFSYGQPDRFSRDYNSGNQAFAQGKAAMYLQGSWAIPTVRTFKPAFDIGTFALPADEPDATLLVSGVDVAITMGREPEHPEESLEFVNYLMSRDLVTAYAKEQSAIPTLEGTLPADPALAGVIPYFEQQRLVGFADHHIPPSIPLPPITQQFLIDGDEDAYLETLDNEWDKVARRRR
jgi:raffinose/stachyose/melibiose transport system substrate-binding protein